MTERVRIYVGRRKGPVISFDLLDGVTLAKALREAAKSDECRAYDLLKELDRNLAVTGTLFDKTRMSPWTDGTAIHPPSRNLRVCVLPVKPRRAVA